MLSLLLALFGAAFCLAAAYSFGRVVVGPLPVPRPIVLAGGAPLLSLAIFALLTAGTAGRASFAIAGVSALLVGLRAKRAVPEAPRPAGRLTNALTAIVLCAYGVLYLVHALAPEIQPDGYTYHLGLVGEWLRLGGFADRVGFYETVPLGLETLFAFAAAFGGYSAAKLVHFAFLAATFPLMVELGRKMKLAPWAGPAAGIFYICAPVAGISGTSSYNDAALVFFVLAAFYLVWAWRERGDTRYLAAAGLAAGFCYAIKFTGLIVAPLVIAFVLCQRRWRPAAVLAGASLVAIAPWMGRNTVIAGNPVAPLFNKVFPNPHFHVSTEQTLARQLRSYAGVTPAGVPLELTIRGRNLHGLTGPLFLLAPLALLALRRREGRILLAAALAMAVPWVFNIGTRFLMPSLAFLSLAMAMALPRSAALALLVLHAAACWPQVLDLYADPGAWRLRGLPWQAALRLESEPDYLRRTLWPFRVAEMIERHAPPGEPVLDLHAAPSAYVRSVLLNPWQSAKADRLTDALKIASVLDDGVLYEVEGSWPEQALTALEIRQTAAAREPWSIQEVQLLRGRTPIRSRRGWVVSARPNAWEAPLALDRNLLTRWASWEPLRPGMEFTIEFSRPEPLTGARLICLQAENTARVEMHGRTPDGEWRRLSERPERMARPTLNQRRAATRLLRRSGVRHVLAPVSSEGLGLLGRSLVDYPGDWGLEIVDNESNVYLLRIP